MKKLKKIFFTLATITSTSAPFLALSCNQVQTKAFSIKGSGGMVSFLVDIKNAIGQGDSQLKSNNNYLEVDINSGGTGSGIDSLLSGNSTFASVTKKPIESFIYSIKHSRDERFKKEDQKNLDNWKAKKIKTIKIAQDNIAFILKVPHELALQIYNKSKKQKHFYFGESNYYKILNAFGGAYELKFNDLLDPSEKLPEKDNIAITPYYKLGGINYSSAAEGLVRSHPYISNPDYKWGDSNAKVKPEAYEYLLNTSTHPKYEVVTTPDPSNHEFQKIQNVNKVGGMAFFSYNFVHNSLEELKKEDYIVLYNKEKSTGKYLDLSIEEQRAKYDFKSDMYLSFNTTNQLSTKAQFLYRIFSPKKEINDKIIKIYEKNFLAMPTRDEIKKMFNLSKYDENEMEKLLLDPESHLIPEWI